MRGPVVRLGPDFLYARLRRAASEVSVPGSLPVLFFGDERAARAATLALNPSSHEYCAPGTAGARGALLTGNAQRFATLQSLGARDRADLTDAQCEEAIGRMRGYFAPGRPRYRYFDHLERFLDGTGDSYRTGTAIHLDLVQESTFPLWGRVPRQVREQLLTTDLPFLTWLIRALPLEVIYCNGRTVSDHLAQLFGVVVTKQGSRRRVRWWVGQASLGERRLRLAGWNIPLNGRTGLTMLEKTDFGRMISREVA